MSDESYAKQAEKLIHTMSDTYSKTVSYIANITDNRIKNRLLSKLMHLADDIERTAYEFKCELKKLEVNE